MENCLLSKRSLRRALKVLYTRGQIVPKGGSSHLEGHGGGQAGVTPGTVHVRDRPAVLPNQFF